MEIFNTIKDKLQGKIPTRHKRASQWPKVRDQHLKDFPSCAVCGKKKKLQVHHKKPFHLHPELELLPTNLITLCEQGSNCHLTLGHAGNFKGVNPDVEQDALTWKQKFSQSTKEKS